MKKKDCSHLWEMTDVITGLIVMKKCFHCDDISTCFIPQNEPPLGTSHEKEHFWNFMGSYQSFHFNLKCSKCRTKVNPDEMVGIMMCTGCDDSCEVNILRRKLEPEQTRVYIVLEQRPVKERKQLPQEKFLVLEEFFDQKSIASKCKIRIVPLKMVRDLSTCYAKPIKDTNVLFSADINEK